jgi:hypothetical protein
MPDSVVTLFAARSQQTILAQMYALATQLGVDVVGVQAERLFTSLFTIESYAKSQEDALRVQVAQAGFLQTVAAAGSVWVTLLAAGWFNLQRQPATPTQGVGLLTCGPLAVPGQVAANQARWATGTGVTFTNYQPFYIQPNSVVPVFIQATVAGSSGNVPLNSTWSNITSIANATLANTGQGQQNGSWISMAGSDAEADATLIQRCLSRWAATSWGGARSAYREWVNNAWLLAGQPNPIIQVGVDDSNPDGPGSTRIYLTDSAGPATSQELAVVNPYLQSIRSLGTGPLLVTAPPAADIQVVATIYGNSNGVALATAALAALQPTIPLGTTVYFADLLATIWNACSLTGVTGGNVVFTSPAPGQDTYLSGYQTPILVPTLQAFG